MTRNLSIVACLAFAFLISIGSVQAEDKGPGYTEIEKKEGRHGTVHVTTTTYYPKVSQKTIVVSRQLVRNGVVKGGRVVSEKTEEMSEEDHKRAEKLKKEGEAKGSSSGGAEQDSSSRENSRDQYCSVGQGHDNRVPTVGMIDLPAEDTSGSSGSGGDGSRANGTADGDNDNNGEGPDDPKTTEEA